MEKWRRREIAKVFLSLQRAEWLYRALETLSVTVMGIAIYLSVFSGRLCRRILENGRAMGDAGSVLRFSQAGLRLLAVCCVFVGIFTLQGLRYFSAAKNRRRSAILRLLGLAGKWAAAFDAAEAAVASAVSFPPSFFGARIIFSMAARGIAGADGPYIAHGGGMAVQAAAVQLAVFAALMASRCVSGSREPDKAIGERLRGEGRAAQKGDARRGRRMALPLAGAYFAILATAAGQTAATLIGTAALLVLWLFAYSLGRLAVRLTEKSIAHMRGNRRKAGFMRIAMLAGNVRDRSAFLSSVAAMGLLLFYFLLSVDWGMAGFLERFWIQSRQTNMYLECAYGGEGKVREWLDGNGIACQELYVRELPREGVTLAVSKCGDEGSPYYVREGRMRTVEYNLSRWGVSEGDEYCLQRKSLLIDKPMKEEGLQLIGYTCIVNYADWKDRLDGSYTAAFAICADRGTLAAAESWAERNGIGVMTASRYMDMAKRIYAPYLNMLKAILAVLSASVLLFLFASALSNIIAREREFFVYRGCGVGWGKICGLVMTQFMYVAASSSMAAAIEFWLAFNGVKLLWLGNATAYFVGVRQMAFITLLVMGLVGAECYIAMGFMRKRNGSVARQLRSE